MSYEAGDKPTPHKKAELQKKRFETGRQMLLLLQARSLHETHDTIHDRENDQLDDTRRAVWRAENDALRADPAQQYEPLRVSK